MTFQEARHLSVLFPDKYRLFAQVVPSPAHYSTPSKLLWALDYLPDLAPLWIEIDGNWPKFGYSPDAVKGQPGRWYFDTREMSPIRSRSMPYLEIKS